MIRLFTGLVALVAALALPAPAQAQEWKIYLLGRTDPIVADTYVEDAPWIFFHDDQSMYLFAVGCNRIERVERAGRPIPKPPCPVDRLPTTMPQIYIAIMDLEAKRLDDSIAKLREQTRAYAEAVVGSVAATRGFGQGALGQLQGEIEVRRALNAVAFMRSQINDTLLDIRLSENRVGALYEAARAFPPSWPPRFFFFNR
jgi:hypothetical protein